MAYNDNCQEYKFVITVLEKDELAAEGLVEDMINEYGDSQVTAWERV